MRNRANSNIADLVVLLLISLIGLVCTYDIAKFIDIELYDESYALHAGISLSDGFPTAEFSPIYALWYHLLSVFEHDPVNLYFLNFKAMTLLPPLLLFPALRVNRVSRILSFALSLGCLFTNANFPVTPKVSHFAIIILLLGFICAGSYKSPKILTLVLAMTSLVTSYVRPEFFVSFAIFGVMLFFFSVRTIKQKLTIGSVAPLAAVFTAFTLLTLSFGFPIGSGNRSMTAFGQHYAVNFVSWHNDQRDPWSHWGPILEIDFGDADSPAKAIVRNPMAMAHHVLTNLRNLPHEVIVVFGSTFPHNRFANTAFRLGMVVVLAGGIMHIRKRRERILAYRFIQKRIHFWKFLIFPLVLLLPSAISITLIAPRHHYLLIIGVILGFSCIVFLFRNTDHYAEDSNFAILALVCLLPFLAVRPWFTMIGERPQPNLKLIQFLRALNIDRPVNILEADGGYGIYAGRNYKVVDEFNENIPFRKFMFGHSINMIILSDRIRNDSRIVNDPDWQSLIKSPSEWGFTQVSVPEVSARSLLIKKDIIVNHRPQN